MKNRANINIITNELNAGKSSLIVFERKERHGFGCVKKENDVEYKILLNNESGKKLGNSNI